ncbi:hypothetical protein ACFVH6_22670 [Spirillospora sp. NPDC127200]
MTAMLAEAAPTGTNYWLVLAPIVIAIAIVTWIAITRSAARKHVEKRPPDPDATGHRGPVEGGIIEGDPGQRKP